MCRLSSFISVSRAGIPANNSVVLLARWSDRGDVGKVCATIADKDCAVSEKDAYRRLAGEDCTSRVAEALAQSVRPQLRFADGRMCAEQIR